MSTAFPAHKTKIVATIGPASESPEMPAACQGLVFSYGVHPVDLAEEPADWRAHAAEWLREHGITAERVMLAAGPSARNPSANYRIELMPLGALASEPPLG